MIRCILLTGCFLLILNSKSTAQELPAWKIEKVADYLHKKNDTLYVINFWATFCKPCVAELPYLHSISAKYKDHPVKLMLVSLDMKSEYPVNIQQFAKSKHFTADMVWLDETNADHFCPAIDSTWSGSIPATIFINAKTGYRKFLEQEMKPEAFETELQKAIK